MGGVYVPHDGVVSPTDLTNAYAKKAKERGVVIKEKCSVINVNTDGRKVTSIETNLGKVDCKYFVNAAGLWGKQLGERSNPQVSVPVHATEHFYIVTKPMDGIDLMTPCIRDYDGHIYFREWSGGLLAGGFEPRALPCFKDSIPDGFEFQLLPENWDQFQILWEEIAHRVPAMETAEIRQQINGPESFTPDSGYLVGPAPEVKNYYLAAGMSSIGIVSSAGIGKAVAEWILDGKPSMDFTDFDIRRFGKIHQQPGFLATRASELLSVYSAATPGSEVTFSEGRDLRISTLHEHLKMKGAYFHQSMGWERVSHFNPRLYRRLETQDESKDTFGSPNWLSSVEKEVEAFKKNVGLIDSSSMVILNIESDDDSATQLLEMLSYSDIRTLRSNSIIQTGMLNRHAGYEAYCYLWKRHNNRYTIMAPAEQETRLTSWINRHVSESRTIKVDDQTEKYTILQLIGPKAKFLIQNNGVLCNNHILLPNTNYENYLLFINKEDALSVFEKLAANENVTLAGNDALRFMEIENKEVRFGLELTPHVTPLALQSEMSSLSHEKNYIGKEALQSKLEKVGAKKTLTQFIVDKENFKDLDLWIWAHEPVYKNGNSSGYIISSAYNFEHDQHICWALVDETNLNDNVNDQYNSYEIEIASTKVKAKRLINIDDDKNIRYADKSYETDIALKVSA